MTQKIFVQTDEGLKDVLYNNNTILYYSFQLKLDANENIFFHKISGLIR